MGNLDPQAKVRTIAVVLLSGGLDSATALAQVLTGRHTDDVSAVSILYGQRHAIEVNAAVRVAHHYGVAHQAINLPPLFAGGRSALTGTGAMPHLTYAELSKASGPSPTYVPYRNGVLLSIAAAVALRQVEEYLINAEEDVDAEVWFGAHWEDAHNWAYPDCTPEFTGAMANAIYVGSYRKVRLVTPFQWMTKSQIVARGLTLGVPYELTWSCYEDGDAPCGKCPTCIGRAEAFRLNEVADPAFLNPHRLWRNRG